MNSIRLFFAILHTLPFSPFSIIILILFCLSSLVSTSPRGLLHFSYTTSSSITMHLIHGWFTARPWRVHNMSFSPGTWQRYDANDKTSSITISGSFSNYPCSTCTHKRVHHDIHYSMQQNNLFSRCCVCNAGLIMSSRSPTSMLWQSASSTHLALSSSVMRSSSPVTGTILTKV